MNQEIERKYLLWGIPKELRKNMVLIFQGYLSLSNPEIRIRNENGNCYKNIKTGSGLVRGESPPIPITQEEFDQLWQKIPAELRIYKQRYRLKFSDLTWELDQYLRHHKDHYVAEVELPSAETIPQLPPAIQQVLIKEVTEDERYKNVNIAQFGFPE